MSQPKGLTTAQAQTLLDQFGRNVIEGKRRTPIIIQLLGQFKDFMVIILIVASIFAYFAGESVDAIIILSIVILNAGIGFAQEFKAEKAVEALRKLLAPKARVLRDGSEQMIDAALLVPGDVVILNEGDKVSADCELLSENEFMVDESVLTGESVPVKKDLTENKTIFMGTQITNGNAHAVVIKTGMRTEFGKIALLTSETKKDKSPLQKELGHIGAFVGKITIVLAVILGVVGFVIQKRELVDTILFAVSVAVAAVPEGLPTTITVALALGVQRLAKKNAIVKQLSSVETLGSTTVICSDKTGTLTKNEMTVQEILIDSYDIAVRGVGYEPEGSFAVHHNITSREPAYFEYEKKDLPELAHKKSGFYSHLELAMRSLLLCNNARLTVINERFMVLGDPTEGALITVAEKAGFPRQKIEEKHKRIFEIPFDSTRKRMSVIALDSESEKVYGYVKGAPDTLLPLCSKMIKDGRVVELTESKRDSLLKRTSLMANRALRTIAVAYKEVPKDAQRSYTKEEVESELIFVGLVAMMDPPREEVKEAVKLTHKAGIRVFIITGDHGLTAHAVARELGIAKAYGVNIVTGEMLATMSDHKLKQYVAPGQETIFARVSPEHKLRIVQTLKETGEIVAVTGDGVNDAPALKRADIGVAMGITGTDVSKEAANMVLLDDSFGTIVTAIIEGRTIYENMKKFIFFIFSSNIGELLTIFFGIMAGLPSPLTAVFLLIINTLTDVFPALALGVEPVERTILEKPPRSPNSKIMEWPFIKRYLANGVIIGLMTAGTFAFSIWSAGWRFGDALPTDSYLYIKSATMAFVVLTLAQMVHTFNSRSEILSVFSMNFFSNLYLLAAIVFSVTSTVLLVQLPFFHEYIKTTALSPREWLSLGLIAFSVLIFEELRKIFVRRKMPRACAHIFLQNG